MTAPLMEVHGVTHLFSFGCGTGSGCFTALEDINLIIEPGEIVALVGESGSGKSTLAAVMGGQIRPTQGSAKLNNKNVAAMHPKKRARCIQTIPQHPGAALDPRWRLRALMREVMHLHPDLKERSITQALRQVSLSPDLLTRRPRSLSGGQAQRACIARSLLLEPDLLICDEIVAALDPPVRADILSLLCEVNQKRGMAILFITHDLAGLTDFADKIAVLYQGRLVEVTNRLDRARHPYTKALYSLTHPHIRGTRRARLQGERSNGIDKSTGCVFLDRCHRATVVCKTRPPLQHGPNGITQCHHADELIS